MPIATQAAPHVDFYQPAREELEALFRQISQLAITSHVSLGKAITESVRRIGARAYQGRLDELFAREKAEVRNWAVPEGSEVRVRTRKLETELGRVTVRRHGVTLPGADGARFPMDEALELPPELYALALREAVALDAADVSFDRTVARVDRTTAGHVPKRQAEQQVIRAAADFDAFYAQRELPANDTLSNRALEVGSVDGKGVAMRPEALRDATRKEAEAAKAVAVRGDPMAPRKARRFDKRIAVVTANFEQEPHRRTAADVLERLHRDPKGRTRRPRSKKAPRPQHKRVAASVEHDLATGVATMFDEMQRRNPDGARRNVVLVDGDEDQLANIESEASTRNMSITVVLDLIHVIHYLFIIASLLCAHDKKASEAWVSHILRQLLTRHPLDVIATIRQTATLRKLSTEDREARCRADRLTARARVESLREDAYAKLREAVRLERETARETCNLLKTEARRATLPALEGAKKELDAERDYQEELQRIAAGNRKRRAALPRRASRGERQGESDDEVRANISADLVPLFDKVRGQIKGSTRASRTEAFLKYAEEHPGEVLAVLDDASDRLVRELEERQAKEERAARRRPAKTSPKPRRYTDEELEAVPF